MFLVGSMRGMDIHHMLISRIVACIKQKIDHIKSSIIDRGNLVGSISNWSSGSQWRSKFCYSSWESQKWEMLIDGSLFPLEKVPAFHEYCIDGKLHLLLLQLVREGYDRAYPKEALHSFSLKWTSSLFHSPLLHLSTAWFFNKNWRRFFLWSWDNWWTICWGLGESKSLSPSPLSWFSQRPLVVLHPTSILCPSLWFLRRFEYVGLPQYMVLVEFNGVI